MCISLITLIYVHVYNTVLNGTGFVYLLYVYTIYVCEKN